MRTFRSHIAEAKEYVLWGLPKGQTDALHSTILYTQGKTPADVERVKRLAARDGWHSFRVQVLDLSKGWNASKAFARGVRESVEPNGVPLPKREYFTTRFSISGKIVEIYAVHGVPVRHPRNFRWAGPDKRLVPKAGAEVWRWRVRILTDEGWMLMGHIGKAQAREGLPPVRLGDRVEVERLTLDSHTGGHSVRRSWASISQLYDYKGDGSVDWRPNNFARTLHGKVRRAR